MLQRRIPVPTGAGQVVIAASAFGPYTTRLLSFTDLADWPLVFPPDPVEVATIVGTTLDVGTATAGQVLSWTGTAFDWITPSAGGSPGGSTTQIQYNDGGSFAGNGDLTWNDSIKEFVAGDYGNTISRTHLQISPSTGELIANASAGTVKLGDVGERSNLTILVIDDANEWATFTKDFYITNAAKGIVLKDSADVYWRITVDTSGALQVNAV